MDPAQNQTTEGSAPQAQVTMENAAPSQTTLEHNRTLMGVLAYIGPLVLVPFFLAKDMPFVKFHVKQGLVLFAIEAILWVLLNLMMFIFLAPIVVIVNIGLLILSIIGIINVAQNKETELPVVGRYSSLFKF